MRITCSETIIAVICISMCVLHAEDGEFERVLFFQLQVDDNQMMVDKTGVGPGGGPDPPIKSDSTDAAGSPHDSETPQTSPQQPHGSVPLVKTSKSDDHHVPEKSQRSVYRRAKYI